MKKGEEPSSRKSQLSKSELEKLPRWKRVEARNEERQRLADMSEDEWFIFRKIRRVTGVVAFSGIFCIACKLAGFDGPLLVSALIFFASTIFLMVLSGELLQNPRPLHPKGPLLRGGILLLFGGSVSTILANSFFQDFRHFDMFMPLLWLFFYLTLSVWILKSRIRSISGWVLMVYTVAMAVGFGFETRVSWNVVFVQGVLFSGLGFGILTYLAWKPRLV